MGIGLSRLAKIVLVACLIWLPAVAQAQTEPVDHFAGMRDVNVSQVLAVSGGAVTAVLAFNLLSQNSVISAVLADLGRGVAIIGVALIGGAAGNWFYTTYIRAPNTAE